MTYSNDMETLFTKIIMLLRELEIYETPKKKMDITEDIGYPCGLRRRCVIIRTEYD